MRRIVIVIMNELMSDNAPHWNLSLAAQNFKICSREQNKNNLAQRLR